MAGLCDPCDLHPLRGEHPQASAARPQSGIHRRRKVQNRFPASACCNGQKTGRCMALVPVYDGRRTRPHRGHPRRRQNLHGFLVPCSCHELRTPEPCPVTPGRLPSDITGISMYIKEKDTFVYQPGAVMCNLFLADEINRTSAKTQSAFLEVMEEGTVTVDGVTPPGAGSLRGHCH